MAGIGADVEFFQHVAEVLGDRALLEAEGLVPRRPVTASARATKPLEEERRTRTRSEFPSRQRVAPIANDGPDVRAFTPVECLDLSSAGISFRCDEPPVCDQVCIELGEGPGRVWLRARVIHWAPSGGRFAVGCKFLERLDRPAE